MGALRVCRTVLRLAVPFLFFFTFLSGCQMSSLPSQARLIAHVERVDDTGLTLMTDIPALNASGAFPHGWQALPPQKGFLYLHQQWRSPSKRTAVGITHVKMPLPLGTKTLVGLVTNEAGKRTQDGRMIRQWSDDLGREWFEAENSNYYLTGYVMARGFDAWINYSGYRRNEPAAHAEIELARKSLETIVPRSVGAAVARQAAEASAAAQIPSAPASR